MLVTSGMAAIVLATLIWYCDCAGYRVLTQVPLIFGSNAIVAYVLHVALEKLLEVPLGAAAITAGGNAEGSLSVLGHYQAFALEAGFNQFCTVGLWMLLFVGLCYLPVYALYRANVFVRI